MPKLSLLHASTLQGDRQLSILMSLLRGVVGLAVAAGHLRSRVYPGFGSVPDPSLGLEVFAFLTGFAHLAIVVFFVLSGWLVGGGLLDRIAVPGAIRRYAIDRITRLWIVLLPAYVAMLLFAAWAGWLDTSHIDLNGAGDYSAASFIGNLLGLQTMIVPRFGGNYSLWTLANGTWYYVLFPLLLTIYRARTARVRIAATLAVLGIAALLSGVMLLYFSVWLLGAAFSRVRIDTGVLGRRLFLLLFLALAVYFRIAGDNNHMTADTIVQDLAFSLALVLFLSSMRCRPARPTPMRARIAAVARFFAGFSFTLYVIHVPLIDAIVHFSAPFFAQHRLSPDEPLHYLAYAGVLAGIVLLAWLFHLPFEANTHRLRQWIELRLAPGEGRAARRTEPL